MAAKTCQDCLVRHGVLMVLVTRLALLSAVYAANLLEDCDSGCVNTQILATCQLVPKQ